MHASMGTMVAHSISHTVVLEKHSCDVRVLRRAASFLGSAQDYLVVIVSSVLP